MSKLTLEERLELISKMPLKELYSRRALILGAINYCEENGSKKGVRVYTEQLKRIENEIRFKEKGGGEKASPVIIHAQTAKLGAKTKK